MYEFYTELADTFMNVAEGESLNLPLVELPVLLEPVDKFLGKTAKTDRLVWWIFNSGELYYTYLSVRTIGTDSTICGWDIPYRNLV